MFTVEYIGPLLTIGAPIDINHLKITGISGDWEWSNTIYSHGTPTYHVGVHRLYVTTPNPLVFQGNNTTIKVHACLSVGNDYENDEATYTFENYITPVLSAVYNGPEIKKGSPYNKNDITVTISYKASDGTIVNSGSYATRTVDINDCTLSPLTVDNFPSQTVTIQYTDPVSNQDLETTVEINAVRIIKITAVYSGPAILRHHAYNKNDIEVLLKYSIPTYNRILAVTEFTASPTTVDNKPTQTVTVTYVDTDEGSTWTATVEIPTIYIEKIEAVYNGPPIFRFQAYDKSDISVTVIYNDPSYNRILTVDDFTAAPATVDKPVQIVTITYTDNQEQETFTTTVEVPVIYITKLRANYLGGKIVIPDNYDPNDVEVFVEYNFPIYNRQLNQNEYSLSSTWVDKLGRNYYTVTEFTEGATCKFFVIGIRLILDMWVKYVGPPVKVSRFINPDDIIVYADTEDYTHMNRMTIILGQDEYSLLPPGLLITKIGENIRTVHFEEEWTEFTWEGDFTVEGIKRLTDFDTKYNGPVKFAGEPVFNSEVTALLSWVTEVRDDGTYVVEEELITSGWEFFDPPVVTEFNDGYIRTKYEYEGDIFFSDIKVPWKIPDGLRLLAWYEGFRVPVDNTYNPDDVVVLLVLDEKWENRRRLNRMYDHLEFSDYVIHVPGWNIYQVEYITATFRLKQWFPVRGYIPIPEPPDMDFRVVYVDCANNHREVDMTEQFKERMTFEGVLFLSWKLFSLEVESTMLYGLYILTAPRKIGLSNRWDQDWEVVVPSDIALRARVVKTFMKEEDTLWHRMKPLTKREWMQKLLEEALNNQ